jgi:protein-tyrosine phosphatase
LIDIHSHILPAIDDGSPNLETSIKMAEIAVSEGITEMIATPHFIEKDKETDKTTILEKVEELNGELKERSIDLTILPGQEIFITPGVPDLYDEGKLLTLCDGNKYMLVELPLMSIPLYALDVIHSLKLRGLNVILAHPERNIEIARDPGRLREFIKIGALVQVNSLSLLGILGRNAKHTAEKIINSGMAHFIATDCHTARSRSPRIKDTLKSITEQAAKLLLEDNPSKVLKGENIDSALAVYDGKDIGFFKKLTVFINSMKDAREVRHGF